MNASKKKRKQSDEDYVNVLEKREAELLAEVVALRTQVQTLSSTLEANDNENQQDNDTVITDSLSNILNLNAACAFALFNLNGMNEDDRRNTHTYVSAGQLPYYRNIPPPGGHRGYCKNIIINGKKSTRCNKECRQVCIECTYSFGGGDHFYVCKHCRKSNANNSHSTMSLVRYKATVDYNHVFNH